MQVTGIQSHRVSCSQLWIFVLSQGVASVASSPLELLGLQPTAYG